MSKCIFLQNVQLFFKSIAVDAFFTAVTNLLKYALLSADLCVTLHLWLASLYSHYLNSRVMLYQTVGRGSRKIPLKQLRIRGPVRLSETEIATDAEC